MSQRRFLLLFFTLPLVTYADDASINADLKKYAEATRLESIKCDNALDDAINVAGPHSTNLSPDGEPMKDKAQTMAVVNVLAKYPGAPPSSHKVLEVVMEAPDDSKIDFAPVFSVKGCKEVGFFKLWKNVFASARTFEFSPVEKKKIADTALRYIRVDLDGAVNVLVLTLKISVYEKLVDSGLVTLPPAAREEMKRIQRRSNTIREKILKAHQAFGEDINVQGFAALPEPKRQALTKAWRNELRESETLRKEILKIIDRTA